MWPGKSSKGGMSGHNKGKMLASTSETSRAGCSHQGLASPSRLRNSPSCMPPSLQSRPERHRLYTTAAAFKQKTARTDGAVDADGSRGSGNGTRRRCLGQPLRHPGLRTKQDPRHPVLLELASMLAIEE